ncbi:MAG: sigma-70 family RNA polymerase sigma factor [candidate division NC10 bacterium]|nr:sigma-70 family RNA polymerase sigma factor [candidate division NC10 bacterium]MDE2322167.1 sigma-70 family RNA polymerase sigma factor [candidate division NC10 bacterium]
MDDVKPNVAPGHARCEALYREHGARLLRLCRLLLRSPQEAEDVIQEVFLKLVERDAGSDRAMAWGPWLTRVAINACRDRQRAAWWRLWDRTAAEIELVDRDPTPDTAALAGETRGHIWRAFRQLSQRQREVFVLRHLEAWPTQDVADALGLSTGSVKRHLFRAVARLRETLGEDP